MGLNAYSNTTPLGIGAYLYQNTGLTIPVSDGEYSDGTNTFTVSGGAGLITAQGSCPATTTTTTTTTTVAPTTTTTTTSTTAPPTTTTTTTTTSTAPFFFLIGFGGAPEDACGFLASATVQGDNASFCSCTTFTGGIFASAATGTWYVSFGGDYVSVSVTNGNPVATVTSACAPCPSPTTTTTTTSTTTEPPTTTTTTTSTTTEPPTTTTTTTSTTTEPPTTTTTTTSTTTLLVYAYGGTVSQYASSTNACLNQTCGRDYYLAQPSWSIGYVVYDDSALTTTFNGGGNWIAVATSVGSYCSGGWAAVQVDSNGVILNLIGCPTSTTTTTTTTTGGPTTTTTTTTTIPPPETFTLAYSVIDGPTACSDYPTINTSTYYAAPGSPLTTGTIIYTDFGLTSPAPNGFYSNGTNYWNTGAGSGNLQNQTSCGATTTTTTTTTTATPTTTTTTSTTTLFQNLFFDATVGVGGYTIGSIDVNGVTPTLTSGTNVPFNTDSHGFNTTQTGTNETLNIGVSAFTLNGCITVVDSASNIFQQNITGIGTYSFPGLTIDNTTQVVVTCADNVC